MSIDTGSTHLLNKSPYRTPFAKHPTVGKTVVNEMLTTNIIHPSRLCWSFPIAVFDKKDGAWRFYTDFRKLNNISKKSSLSLPVI